MTKLISSINVTPEGFCGYNYVVADEEHHAFANEQVKHAGAVLFGRVTYQLFESFWPQAARDVSQPEAIHTFATLINAIPKFVISKTLKNASWKGTHVLTEINKSILNDLMIQVKGDILILGSPGLIASLTKEGLIDDYYFSIQPMIAGSGKRLFETIHLPATQHLKLVDTYAFKSGVVTLHYQKQA